MTTETLDVLLIEDNPGDARLIEDMLQSGADLLRNVEIGTSAFDDVRIRHENRLSEGLETARETDVDVILLDLGLPESTGLETLATATDETEYIPIVVLTGLRDEGVGIESIQRGAQDFLVKDDVTSELLVRTIRHAIERERQQREQRRRREQLEALNRLNGIVQDVTHAVITTTTRDELERAVVDRLVESDAYRFAWIGEVDRPNDRLVPRVTAGVEEGYLDDVEVRIDDSSTGRGPGGRAVRTREVQTMQNVQTDPAFEPWREEAIERGYRSSAAVPIVHEEFLYGLLSIYATSPEAFSEPEVEILSRLGDVVGHAITAIERREALVSDTVLELDFEAEGLIPELAELTADGESSISFENLIRSEDVVIAYGLAEGIRPETFAEMAAATDAIDEVRLLADQFEEDETIEFEVASAEIQALVDAIATHGGRIQRGTVEDGTFRFVLEFPPGRDKRQLVELVESYCRTASNLAQRTVERPDPAVASSRSIFQDRLTEKQRVALETAYHAGLFDWPRKSTGEEVSDRLGVSSATFTQHLRAAEKSFFEAVFE